MRLNLSAYTLDVLKKLLNLDEHLECRRHSEGPCLDRQISEIIKDARQPQRLGMNARTYIRELEFLEIVSQIEVYDDTCSGPGRYKKLATLVNGEWTKDRYTVIYGIRFCCIELEETDIEKLNAPDIPVV